MIYVVVCIAATTLAGYALGIDWMTRWSFSGPRMTVLTALLFLLVSPLILTMGYSETRLRSAVISGLSAGILCIVMFLLIGKFEQSQLRYLLGLDVAPSLYIPQPGVPSLCALSGFVAVGLAGYGWILEWRKASRCLAVVPLALGVSGIVGYCTRIDLFYCALPELTGMAINTCAAMIAVGVSIVRMK